MMAKVNIATGLETAIDSQGPGTSALVNWRLDGAGTNIPRPPIVAHTITGINSGTTIIGLYEYRDDLIVVGSDRYVYRVSWTTPNVATPLSVSSDTATQLGGTTRPTFAEDPSDLFIAGGGRILRYTPGAPDCEAFSTGPENATHVIGIGQRIVANDTTSATERNQFFWSDLGDGSDSTWDALAFATAEARPDEVVAVYENTDEVFVFGATTLQVYGIGVDATIPFDKVNTVNVGCGARYSPVRIDNEFAFIDETGRIVMNGGHSDEVRDIGKAIVTEIRSMSTYADAFGWRERDGRYDMLCFHFPTEGRTFEFDLDREIWAERKRYDAAQSLQQPMPIGAYCYWSRLKLHMFGRDDTNGLAKIDASVGTELTGPLLCERTTGYHDHGIANKKRSYGVRAVCRRGTAGPTATPGVVEMRVQDDGRLWTSWRSKSIGNDGDNEPSVPFFFGGVFRRRRYDLRYAGSNETSVVEVTDNVVELKG